MFSGKTQDTLKNLSGYIFEGGFVKLMKAAVIIVTPKISVISPPNIYTNRTYYPININIFRKPVRFPDLNRFSIYVIIIHI